MKHLIPGLAASALLMAGSASAQDLSAWKRMTLERADAPEAGSQAGRLPSAIAVTAGADSSEAAISATQSWEDPGNKLGTHNISLRFAATLNKDSGEAAFLSGGGPVGGTSVELSYSRDTLPGTFEAPAPGVGVYTAAHRACRIAEGAKLPVDDDLAGEVLAAANAKKDKRIDAICGPSLEGPDPDGPRPTFNDLRKYLSEREQAVFLDRPFYDAPLVRWGVSAKLGYDEFDYRDPASFAEGSAQHASFGASAFGGMFRYYGKNGVYLGGGVEYSEGYEAGAKRTLCQPAPATGPQECFTSPFAKPDRKKATDVFGVVRWQPAPSEASKGKIGLKGIETKAAYDAESDIYSLGASVYVFADGDNKPRGGLRFAWRSNDDDPATKDDNFNFGVFFGVPFSAF